MEKKDIKSTKFVNSCVTVQPGVMATPKILEYFMLTEVSQVHILNGIDLEIQGLKNFPKVHWSKTSEHQKSTGPEEYRNGGNKIC
jgi:hypothetical protein